MASQEIQMEATADTGASRRKNTAQLAEMEVNSTELVFITAADATSRTFFAQFCKFSNLELITFNQTICNHCDLVVEARKAGDPERAPPKRVHRDDIVCAKYIEDDRWYRAKVLSHNKQQQTCFVSYIDYGNLETVSFDNLVVVDPNELPIIQRAPFGVNCLLKDVQEYDEEKAERFLECLGHNYLMVKMLEPLSNTQWLIDIPKHAYNIPFWQLFNPESKLDTSIDRNCTDAMDALDNHLQELSVTF